MLDDKFLELFLVALFPVQAVYDRDAIRTTALDSKEISLNRMCFR